MNTKKEIFKNTFKISGILFTIATIILSFITFEDCNITSICIKILCLIGILLLSLIISFIYTVSTKENTIWKGARGQITIIYGDIIKTAFSKMKKENEMKIIVIPVNTCFDTIVHYDNTLGNKPLISPNSLHGQWIKNMETEYSVFPDNLNEKIERYIEVKKINVIKQIPHDIKIEGKFSSYERGTIIPIKENKNTTFYLLALAELDENNNAQCSKNEFIYCIKKLIEYYDENGQANEMYVPLMGTGLSRVNINHIESLNIIVSMFKLYNDKIKGKINIVIYKNDKEHVSIYDV